MKEVPTVAHPYLNLQVPGWNMRPRLFAVVLVVCLSLTPAAFAHDGNGTDNAPKPPLSAKNEKADKAKAASAEPAGSVGEFKSQQDKPPAAVPSVAPRAEGAAAVEPGQFQIEFRYNVDGTQLQGNKERSFLWEGVNHTAESNYLMTRPVGDTWRFEHVGAFRYTDNPRVDPERNSVQRMYFRLSGPSFEANAGDALVNYSRFSFNQNIKGLHFYKDLGKHVRYTGTVGYFADRWGTLYRPFSYFRNVTVDCQVDSTPGDPLLGVPSAPAAGCAETFPFSNTFVLDPNNPGKPYARFVAGSRFELRNARQSWLAANWSHGEDLLQSLPSARVLCDNAGVLRVGSIYPGCNLPGEVEVPGGRRPGPESTLNDVFSIDAQWNHEPSKFRLAGEFAASWTAGGIPPSGASPSNFYCATQSPVVGGSVLDSRCFQDRQSDVAYRLEATQRIKKFNWRADYSRFGPDFLSANARQIRDLEDFSVRGELEIIRQIAAVATFRRTTDNLNGERAFTNIVRAPEIRLIFRDLPFYRRMSLEVGYRERNLDTNGTPQPNEQRKRSTRIPFYSITVPAGDNLFTFDYEHRHDSDAVRPPQSADTDRFAFGYRGNFSWGQWDFNPSFRFELERLDKYQPDDPTRSLTDPGLVFPIDFFTGWDTNRSVNVSLLLEAPSYFRFEALYREFNSVLLTPVDPANPTISLLYLNQGFKRPYWRAALTYKLKNDENKTLTLFFERSNNFFDTGDRALVDSKSFRETVIGGTLLLRFRR
jgi:hypothetical protein